MRFWRGLRSGRSGGPWKGLEGFVEVEAWRGGTAGSAGVGCRCCKKGQISMTYRETKVNVPFFFSFAVLAMML